MTRDEVKKMISKSDPRQWVSVDYTISFKVIKNEKISPELNEEISRLYGLCKTDPELAIPRLWDLAEEYPDLGCFYNYLVAAYRILKDSLSAKTVAELLYAEHPDYYFAKASYAELCLNQGQADKIPEIFRGGFDLATVYPGRDCFHISEYSSFCTLMSRYFLEINEEETAEFYWAVLRQVDPENVYLKHIEQYFASHNLEMVSDSPLALMPDSLLKEIPSAISSQS